MDERRNENEIENKRADKKRSEKQHKAIRCSAAFIGPSRLFHAS